MKKLMKILNNAPDDEVRFIRINGKTVQLREPYKAKTVELVGMEEYIRNILASWIGRRSSPPLAPLLVGEAGVGKSRVVYECSKICGKPLFIDQGREDLTDEDLTCVACISDDVEKKIDYKLSNLATALIVGGIYFIDGICKLKPRSQSPYESVLDDRRYVDSILLGERIFAHPGFRFVAATNPEDMENNALPEFMRSRLRPVIHFGYPEREEMEMIIKKHYPVLEQDSKELLNHFWNLWFKVFEDKFPSPRDSLKLFALSRNLADYETLRDKLPLNLEHKDTPAPLKKRHLEEAFEILYDSSRGK